MLFGNAIVGQSRGPTSAINATLSGVIRACLENKETINTLYGMRNGIEGFLKEDFVDLFSFFEDTSRLKELESTPASALGSCRKKLPEPENEPEVFEKIFEILEKHNIRYLFYIGGNDSMDTVDKLSRYAKNSTYEVRIIGVPKTIDNDLCITDHTPGFGSCAKFISTVVEEIIRDVSVYTLNAVTIVEIMGRDAGWLTASSSLCGRINGKGVDLIYLPERVFSAEQFVSDVKNALKKHPAVVVCVSEGLKYASGEYVSEDEHHTTDAYGHKYLSGTARMLTHLLKREIGCKVRAVELNLPQRAASHIASKTDISESVRLGKGAVRLALDGQSGRLPVFKRKSGKYAVEIKSARACDVANKIKKVPNSFINEEGNGVTSECIEYLLPLIQGEHYPKYKDGLPVHCIIK